MTLYHAIFMVGDMAIANIDNITFNNVNKNEYDNLSGDCLRLHKVDGGYDAVIQRWKGYQGLTVNQIKLVWKMAGVLLAYCTVEMD